MMARASTVCKSRPAPFTLYDNSANWQYPLPRRGKPPAPQISFQKKHHLKTVAFTGHRPEKLPWGSNDNSADALMYKFRLREALEYLIGVGYVDFMSGAARGFDTIAAETVISLREVYPWIRLIVVLPCADQAAHWSPEECVRWENIVHNSDHVETMARTFDRGCMFRRNRYLVDNADMLLAAYDGVSSGGTAMTVDYARKCGVTVRRLGFEKKGPLQKMTSY